MLRMTLTKLMIIEQSGFRVFFKALTKQGNVFLGFARPYSLSLKTQLRTPVAIDRF